MRQRALPLEIRSPLPALLLALVLPAAKSSLAAPETLVFTKAKTETLYVHIDYARDPEVAPDKPWGSWNEIKVDSFYVTDSGTSAQARHVHYAHPFYAEVNGIQGSASDYIYFVDGSSGVAPEYTAEIGFDFRFGDTLSGWESANGWHMADYPRLGDSTYAKGVRNGDIVDFRDYRTVGEKDVSDHVLLDLVARRSGWIGKSGPTALAVPGSGDGGIGNGTWAGPLGQAFLTVPAAATRLRIIDAAGRTAWEAEGLVPGARVSAPAGLRPGIFRCLWGP